MSWWNPTKMSPNLGQTSNNFCSPCLTRFNCTAKKSTNHTRQRESRAQLPPKNGICFAPNFFLGFFSWHAPFGKSFYCEIHWPCGGSSLKGSSETKIRGPQNAPKHFGFFFLRRVRKNARPKIAKINAPAEASVISNVYLRFLMVFWGFFESDTVPYRDFFVD